MEKFPSELELIAASALLQLPFAVFSEKQKSARTDFNDDTVEVASVCQRSAAKREKSTRSDSRSAERSWLTSSASSGAAQARRMKLMSMFSAKLKSLRRRRSQLHRRFQGREMPSLHSRKFTASASFQSVSDTTSEVSCLSSSRSDLSSARIRKDSKEARSSAMADEELKRRGTISSNIRQRAGAILNILSRGCSSEVRIRQLLGDSPDTSKALRILLKRAEVRRTGAGGRSDPYIYTISGEAQERPC